MASILVVEDETVIQFLVRNMLQPAGHSVYEAGDGEAALVMLETFPQPFDLIILDLLMPKMNGFEFLSKLQNQTVRPPVIILSAHEDKIPQALENMVSGRLLKPFGRQDLNAAVNSLLGESPTAPAHRTRHTEEETQYDQAGAGND
ncbi:MAG TPA: response regulator [Phototrophicaceae bacterium]|nr:response regulator [Phototrophicaceae bacterium]